MTIIAGLMSRNGTPLAHSLRKALISNLSRHPNDVVETFEGVQWLLAKVDIGAFGAKASVGAPGGPALVLAGEPLLTQGEKTVNLTREGDTQQLFDALSRGSSEPLRDVTGAFCAAFYSPQSHSLTLIADKLSVRPIYYIVTPQLIAFSSALRVLEMMGLCGGDLDLRGTCEMAAFGYPLGDRTCYAGVRTIQPSEVVQVTSSSESHSRYFRWDQLENPVLSEEKLIDELVRLFGAAVRKRLRRDSVTVSFLSGGLDSRAIAAALRNQGAKVFTVNFAPPDTQDRVFAALAAEALGTAHHQIQVSTSGFTNFTVKEKVRKWYGSPSAPRPSPERPACIWSGDGGSVGLGHVYLNDEAVSAFERGDVETGVRAYLRYNGIAATGNSAMSTELRSKVAGWIVESVKSEIVALQRRPDARALHLFLMFNDQRRHLADQLEDIDIERFEFHLPFFDSRFLEAVARADARPFLRHSLYYRWLKALSPAAMTVPWQAYPNHEPCPLTFEGELRYQWGGQVRKIEERRMVRKAATQAVRYVFMQPFPRHLIHRGRFGIATLLSLLGATSYGHVLKVGNVFAMYWQRSHAGRRRRQPS